MEKLGVKEAAVVRADAYAKALAGFTDCVVDTIKGGGNDYTPDGTILTVTVTVKNPEKFDPDAARQEYADQLAKNAARAEAARIKAEEKGGQSCLQELLRQSKQKEKTFITKVFFLYR